MTPQRRAVLAASGALAAVVVALIAFAALRGDGDGGDRVTAETTTSSSTPDTLAPVEESTTTTFDLMPESTTTTAPRPPSTTSTTAAPLPVVTGEGAVLRRQPSAAARTMSGDRCETLADDGWAAECGIVRVKGGGKLVWLVESRPVTVGSSTLQRRAYVFGPASGGGTASWRVLLDAADDKGTRWKSVTVRAVDLSGDGADEIVWGFRAAGSANGLALDVVEGPGTVVVHRDLAAGSARVSQGQLDTWALASGSASSGTYQHDVVRWQDNAWRIVLRASARAADVPPSHF